MLTVSQTHLNEFQIDLTKLISPLLSPLITAIENTAFMEYVPMKEPWDLVTVSQSVDKVHKDKPVKKVVQEGGTCVMIK